MAPRPSGPSGTRHRGDRDHRAGRARPAAGARGEALRILLRVGREGAWASRLLGALDDLDPRDLALTREIVLGVLRWRGRLDAEIARLAHRLPESLDPPVLESLRIGAYQILFLDRVPHRAAVDESVELVRRAAGRGEAGRGSPGLVNAVLRKLADERSTSGSRASLAPRGQGALSVEVSHPEWLVERAVRRFGEREARALLLANNRPAAVTLRPNPAHAAFSSIAERLVEEGVETAPGRFVPGALCVLKGLPARTRLFAEGAFWIQDEASQLVPLLFPRPWDGLTGDICAAPGGKSLVLATGPGAATVAAFDLHPHRIERMAERTRRIAPVTIAMAAADIASASPIADGVFERVLVDAPCSGTGVLGRHPEIRWRLRPEQLAPLAALQSRLLDAAHRALMPGGWLVYSVCSLEPEEGEEVLEAFLARSGGRLVDPRGHLPDGARGLVGDGGVLRTLPHRDGTDGFFAALVQKP